MIFDKQADQIDIKALLLKYLKYWYLFLGGVILAVFAAKMHLRYATPIYQANTTLLFKGEQSGGGISEAAAFSDIELLNATRSIDNEMLVLKSRSLMEKVITRLDLEVQYLVEGSIRDVEIYGEDVSVKLVTSEIKPEAYGKSFVIHFKDDNSFDLSDGNLSTHRFGQEIVMPYGNFTVVSAPGFDFSENNNPLTVRFVSPESQADKYRSRLSVSPVNNQASVLQISITDPNPEKAKDILQKLIEVYDEDNVDDKNQIAERTVEFIDDRLEYLTKELSDVEVNVENYKKENELTDVSSQAQQYVQAAGTVRKDVEELDIQLELMRSIERYLSQSGNEYELVPSALNLSDPTLVSLTSKFNELQLERERMLRTVLPANPVIQNINEQLSNLRSNILENLKNIKSALGITRRNLLAKSGTVGDQIQQVPVIERQLIEITRQQEIKQALYLYLLQKKEESALSLAATVSNSRTIDPAHFVGQVSPNASNTLAYAVLLGLFIPFLGLYLKNLITNKVETRADVRKMTDTPILGELCHDATGKTVVADATNRTPIAEMFRLLRTNLRFSSSLNENRVILVTSSMSGDGKTFISINLACSLAGAGKKVLVIEFDLRRPKLFKSLGREKQKGLTDYLVGDVEHVSSVIYPSEIDSNLDLICAGTLPPNPAEIILNPKVNQLIADMRLQYDYIILDTSPVGKVADALTMKPLADTALYVIRYDYTDKDLLKVIDDIYVNQRLNNPLIVMNDAKKASGGKYAYGY